MNIDWDQDSHNLGILASAGLKRDSKKHHCSARTRAITLVRWDEARWPHRFSVSDKPTIRPSEHRGGTGLSGLGQLHPRTGRSATAQLLEGAVNLRQFFDSSRGTPIAFLLVGAGSPLEDRFVSSRTIGVMHDWRRYRLPGVGAVLTSFVKSLPTIHSGSINAAGTRGHRLPWTPYLKTWSTAGECSERTLPLAQSRSSSRRWASARTLLSNFSL